jgi:hypothetical protein
MLCINALSGYLEYQALLQKLGKETSHLCTFHSEIFTKDLTRRTPASRSLDDLRFKPAEALRVRRYSVSDVSCTIKYFIGLI